MTAAEIKIKKMNTPHRLSRLWRISAPLMLTYKGGNVPYFGPKFLYYDCIFLYFMKLYGSFQTLQKALGECLIKFLCFH